MNVIQTVEVSLQETAKKLFQISDATSARIELTLNTDASKQQFGDLSSNCALILAKELGMQPRVVAQKIQEALENQFIERIEIAGPGFINIFLTPSAYQQLAKELFTQGEGFFKDAKSPKQHYSIEFVSANPTGPLHIGHGRGGIIGDVLARILTFLENKVTKEFYINDAGAQIEKLGISFKIRCQQIAGMNVQLPEDAYHGEYLMPLAQECYKQYGAELLSQPEEFFAQYAKKHLLARIQETLAAYGITFDTWFSEKQLHTSGAIEKILQQLETNGYLYTQDNALWFKSTLFGDDKDRVVRKNTGELTYIAPDFAYAENKIERGHDHLIMILGQDHHSYVTRLKAVMQALGYDPNRLDVIMYQLVTIKEGGQIMRLSKRAGRIITLEDIIETVGTDVARFFYLHKKADGHLDFDLELALKHTDENPVYYIQYAYVRTKSIMAKAAAEQPQMGNIAAEDAQFVGEPEYLLLKKIASLKTLLESTAKNYQTHLIAYYVIELAQTFHSYYSHHTVIDSEHLEQSRGRLFTILLIQRTLKTCFDLLGISAPERM